MSQSITIDGHDIIMPDPYSYPHEYYQVLIPTALESIILDFTNDDPLPSAQITYKSAVFKKERWVESDGRRTMKWAVHSANL